MRNKKRIISSVLVALVIACLIFSMTACNDKTPGSNIDKDALVLNGGSRPEYASLISEANQAIIDAALADDAELEDKKIAAVTLFNIATRSRIDTELSLMVQSGGIYNNIMDLLMTGFTVRDGNSWYYQLPGQMRLGNLNLGAIYPDLENMGNLLQVAYTEDMSTYNYIMARDALAGKPTCVDIDKFPFATFTKQNYEFGTGDNEWLKNNRFFVESQLEIVNIAFNKYILDTVEITKEDGLYTLNFAVDCSAECSSSDAFADAFAGPAADTENGSPGMKRNYDSYVVTLTVWDNGYAQSYHSVEVYHTVGGGFPNNLMNGSASQCVVDFKYYWDEEEILELLNDDETIVTEDTMVIDDVATYIDAKIDYINGEAVDLPTDGGSIAKTVAFYVCLVLGIVLVIAGGVELSVACGTLPKLAKQRAARRAKRNENKK